MKDSETQPTGRTRWRRVPLVMIPAFGAVSALMVGIASGALAVNFSMSGMPFVLKASSITGSNFVQYAQPDSVTNSSSGALITMEEALNGITPGTTSGVSTTNGATMVADTITAMHNAQITGMTQTVCAPVPTPFGLGSFNLQVKITAGGKGTPASAGNLLVNSPAMTADSAVFGNIQIGADAKQALDTAGYPGIFGARLGPGYATGNFSQSADTVTLNNVTQVAIGTAADSFTLAGLGLSASFVNSCP